ncbi:MAG: helix-turn-helix domain-containing protein [Alphaproteobacteria bacterium]
MLIIVNTIIFKPFYNKRKIKDLILNNRLKNIGNNIRQIRKQRQVTQIDLAVMIGIDRAYLSEIENGRTNVSLNILYAIADALNTDIIQFFNRNEKQ